ncbi:MAG: hypothetical protein WBM08_14530 [Prochlorococcaceae cyanobacterium]
MFVYITVNEPQRRTRYRVGHYRPDGCFVIEHETYDKHAAAARTSWLNGGSYCDIIKLDYIEYPPTEIH